MESIWYHSRLNYIVTNNPTIYEHILSHSFRSYYVTICINDIIELKKKSMKNYEDMLDYHINVTDKNSEYSLSFLRMTMNIWYVGIAIIWWETNFTMPKTFLILFVPVKVILRQKLMQVKAVIIICQTLNQIATME